MLPLKGVGSFMEAIGNASDQDFFLGFHVHLVVMSWFLLYSKHNIYLISVCQAVDLPTCLCCKMHLGVRWTPSDNNSDAGVIDTGIASVSGNDGGSDEEASHLPICKAVEVSHLHRVYLDQVGPNSFVLVDTIAHNICKTIL